MLRRRIAPRVMLRQAGFTLLEVMVSVLVVAVGLLGLAKMQALAISSSQVSSSRSLVALQASSLAAAMHGGKAYWGVVGTPPATFTITGTTISDSALSGGTNQCTAADPCVTPVSLASRDVQDWAASMNAAFPNHKTTVKCGATGTAPVSCVISIDWTEKTVASVNQGASAPAESEVRTYVMYVEP